MNWDITQPAQSLQWWGAFTDVKHNRYEQLKQAKQENVLNILGALYLIEMLYLKKSLMGQTNLMCLMNLPTCLV